MSALSPILRGGVGFVTFWCPGCSEAHVIPYGAGDGPRWSYNGNPAAPTFSPSVLIRSGHHVPGHTPPDPCWCGTDEDGQPWPFMCSVCHSFVTDGRIQFLNDCTHPLAGQTVNLPEFPA